MAILRAYVAGTSPIRLAAAAARVNNQRIPALLPITYRTLSTTPRAQAQHTHDHHSHSSAATDVNPYAGGPSAIEKAAHLFFLTEIFRGTCSERLGQYGERLRQ